MPYAWITLTVVFLVYGILPIVLGDTIVQKISKKVRIIMLTLNKCTLLNIIQLGVSLRRNIALQQLAKSSFVNVHIVLCIWHCKSNWVPLWSQTSFQSTRSICLQVRSIFLKKAENFCIFVPINSREVRTKINVRTYENETMSYQEPRQYIFDRERSVDDETFTFTTVDTVYMVNMIFYTVKKSLRICLFVLFRR